MAITISNGFTITPNGGGSGNNGGTGWFFYSDEGVLNANPPTANGNAIFLAGGFGGDETFDPNQSGDYNLLILFNTINSVGANFTGDFNGATEPGGVVTITQGSNVAEYFNPNGVGMRVETSGPLAGVFIIETEYCIQTQTAASAFNQNDVITLSFSV